MTRQNFLLSLTLLAGCRSSSKSIAEILPAQVGDWSLKDTRVLPAEEAPAVVQSLGLQGALSAMYAGEPEMRVRIYEMKAEASAFELIQKWRQDESMALYKGPYFIVADAEGKERASVSTFLHMLQQSLQVP